MTLRKAISVKTFESLNRRMSFKAHDQFRFTNSQLGSSKGLVWFYCFDRDHKNCAGSL